MSIIIKGKTIIGPNIITSGLTLHIIGNNVIGSTLYDKSVNSINGTLTNGLTYSNDEFGKLIYTGNDDYVNFGSLSSSSPLSLTSNFTIEQVFKPTAYQPNNYFGLTNILLIKGNLSTVNYLTQLNNSTTVNFVKISSSESLQAHTFTVPSMTNNINTLTFVIQSNTTLLCYFNGTYIDQKSITGLAIEAQATETTSISRTNVSSDMTFIGHYYSCRVYNRVLSDVEIKRNYNMSVY